MATASTRIASTPATVTTSCRRVETRMSSSASTVTSPSSGKNHVYQPPPIPVWAFSAADQKKLAITSTNDTPMAKPPA